MTPRPTSRKRTVLAVAVTAGVTLQSTTLAAHADDDKRSVESFLADLVGQVSRAKTQVSNMETLMGSLREDANKARVDLTKSQDQAQKAQNKVVDARGRLKSSDSAVSKAQAKLNDIARSAYAQGGDASPINLAASGSDAVGDTLDRSSYIQAAAKKQQGEVDRLDLARTQNANEESSLRDSRDKANSAVGDAVKKYNTARDTLRDSQQKLSDKQAEYKRLLDEKKKAEKALRDARAAVEAFTKKNPEASSWDKRKVAEKAAEKVGASVDNTTVDNTDATPTEETTPADKAPETTSETTTEAPKATETNESTEPTNDSPAPQGSLGNPAALPELPAELRSSYDQNVGGDNQRQSAIDGLAKAAQSAAMAGFNTALSGNPEGALDAAARAGRETAGKEYDRAMGRVTNVDNPIEAPETPAAEAPETPEAETPANPADVLTQALDPNAPDTSGTAEEKIERVIKRAESQLGLPYAWGGGNFYGPTKGIRDGGVADAHGDYNKVGFDCSGLMMYAFYGVGFKLDHYSGYQYTAGKQVPSSEAKRGDMLFWPGHVALYLGDGKMIEAPQSGDVVKISDVRWGGMQPMAVRMIE
ncbi:DIP1281 family NlpC/P60 protein [Corynebacterium macclintockiae]|uniref:DIP1281 family NlpC/P60 protein n=1 Tax=Corynebacterium macclintockiae TaxID=2913501 RepID=UPI00254E7623|nr:NlpC/P60 family protein [Corynebacterium macclintockiae]MDK8869078.1 NlpC/P60 family protein [Corynebacterium macclintockiae]